MVDEPAGEEQQPSPPAGDDKAWQSPSGGPTGDPSGSPGANPQEGAPQYGQPQYGQQHYEPPQYGPPQYGPPQYGPPQYGPPQYGPPQYGPPQYGPPGPDPPGYAPPGYAQPGAGPAYGPGYGPPGAWGPTFAEKPGVIPLRPLAVGEILDGVFTTIRQNPKALLGLSFIIVLVGQLLNLGVNLSVHDASLGTRELASGATIVITQLIASVATGAAVVVISEAVLGTRISPGEALNRLNGRIWRLVGLSFLVSLLTLLGVVLLIIPGIYVAVLLSFATPVFVLERTRVGEALSRSAELVRGAWWRTFGIALLGGLVGGIISGIVQVPFTIFTANSSQFFSTSDIHISVTGEIVLAVGRIIGGTISTPIIAGTIALMYVDRRIRREALDIALAQAARERRGQH